MSETLDEQARNLEIEHEREWLREASRTKREASRTKRAKNRETSRTLLVNAGLSFTVHNDGAHIVVEKRWDFWPGTGKWADRRGGGYRRGVFPLINAIDRVKRRPIG